MENLIYEKEGAVDKKICDEIIARFERDANKRDGETGWGIIKDIKDTTDLRISGKESWKDIDQIIFNIMTTHFNIYTRDKGVTIDNEKQTFLPNDLMDTGYQIQKYKKNQGKYTWHTDTAIHDKKIRYLTFIIYLNTIEDGGETDFVFKKIKPTAGKIIYFPATWTFPHCGRVPISDDKYIITGWLMG